VTLGKLIGKQNIYVAPRFARIYVENTFGTPLLQGSQLPLARPYDLKYISTTRTVGLGRWLIKAGWVLVTCSGTIGRVAISTARQEGWAASQHILRVKPPQKVLHPGFMLAFLASPYGQHQVTAKTYGGVVDELSEDDMAAVMVPNVPYAEQAELGRSVVEAYDMRDEANDLELEAIDQLEIEIRGSVEVRSVGPAISPA
jgi:type I restriction enzyme S subunit